MQKVKILSLLLSLAMAFSILTACGSIEVEFVPEGETKGETYVSLDDIPPYSGDAYVEVNGNVPFFKEEEISEVSFEEYAPLDSLGRCGTCFASIGTDLMPTEKRGDIGHIKPTGWHSVKYDFVNGKNLYNRCHLIGFQLTAENDNRQNLITGTRYLNVKGMLPFENLVADYIKETENHVMYRVTPIFYEDNLVADGVLMEGYSVEDGGDGVSFCVYAYNIQPGVEIDYATGESFLAEENKDAVKGENKKEEQEYILNTSSKKFHLPDCAGANSISEENREVFVGSREELIDKGYSPCGKCKP